MEKTTVINSELAFVGYTSELTLGIPGPHIEMVSSIIRPNGR